MIEPGQARNRARRYALLSTAVAMASGLALLPLGLVLGPTWFWCFFGWALMAVIGVIGGARLAGEHGRPGSGFLVVLVTCILLRLLGVGVGAIAAALQNGKALWSYLAGAAVGFVTLQVFEAAWFYMTDRVPARLNPMEAGREGVKSGVTG